jgi:hypothetical protein
MKTKKMNLKAIVLSLGLVAMMLPANAMVQETAKRPGGLFGFSDQFVGEGLFQIRAEEEEWDLNVQIQNFQDPAPLGSGIAILIGAGLGYVALKKKEDKQ